jgi:hypothetical protein
MTSKKKRDSKSPAEHKPAAEQPPKAAGDGRDAAKEAVPARAVSRRPLWISLLVVSLFVAATLLVFTPRYETNDDVGMNASVAGRLGFSQPDEHLLFSNVLIGLALKKCYAVWPGVPWYGGYLFLTAALSLAAICYVFLSQKGSEWNWLLIATFLLVAGIPFLIELQFTRVASVAALAGLLLLAGSVRAERNGWQCGVAAAFLIAAGLIRFESFFLICLVLSPVIAWMFWRMRRWFRAWIPCAVLLGCVALVFAAHRFDAWYYDRDPDWKEFHRFNALLAEFTDFGHVDYTPETAPVIASAGWLPIDYLMLQNWACLDRDRFNVQTLQAVVNGLPPRSHKPTRPLLDLFQQMIQDNELLGLWALAAAGLVTLSIDRSARFVPLACYVVTAVVCVLLYEYLRLPARVYCPAFAACAVTPMVFAAGPRSLGRRGPWTESAWGRRVILLLVVALFVWRGSAMWQANAEFREDHRQAALMMKELAPRPTQLYVVWAASFPYEYLVLPFESESLPRDFKVLGLDGRAQTPPTLQRMKEFGVTDMRSIVRRGSGTYLICERLPANMLRVYLEAHYGMKVVYYLNYSNAVLGAGAVWQMKYEDSARPSS